MWSVCKKELRQFFSSLTGYIAIIVFLLVNGLLLFVFRDNVFDFGYATLGRFFELAPWVLLLLIPAITMRSFSEEFKTGTFELLQTRPLTLWEITTGKYLGSLIVVVIALLPTIVYYFSIQNLSSNEGIDTGATVGSYIGLFFLAAVFTAIGICSSSFTTNPVVAFIISLIACALLYYGFDAVSQIAAFEGGLDYYIGMLGIDYHYRSISRGVIDARDVIYFVSLILIILAITILNLVKGGKRKKQSFLFNSRPGLITLVLLLIGLNYLATLYHPRIDLTKEKRYTLSNASKRLAKSFKSDVNIDVFLKGEFPAGFRKLAISTDEFLQLLKDENGSRIHYRFISPEDEMPGTNITYGDSLVGLGAVPINLTVQKKAGQSSNFIFPVAVVEYQGKKSLVNLYPGASGRISQEEINSAEALMEYQFANALSKIVQTKKPYIGYSTGNGQPIDARTWDMVETLKKDYDFFIFDLQQQKIISDSLDALLIVKPTQAFSEEQKFKLDQYVMRGGKLLCFIDNLIAEQDSLSFKPETIAFDRNLNLTDLFFRYGLRINTDLVMDLQCDRIPMIVGGSIDNPQFEFLSWNYFPLFSSNSQRFKNAGLVSSRFANSIDTINVPGVTKTVLLSSSDNSRIISTPALISLNENKSVPQDEKFRQKGIPTGMLLEGRFTSLYNNRVSKSRLDTLEALGFPFQGSVTGNKMIVVADGDVVLNDIVQNGPLPMGWNKYTYTEYLKESENGKYFIPVANREFLLSCVEFLVNDPAISQTRNKDIVLRLLDSQKINEQKSTWQFINIGLPILLVIIFGWIYQQVRKRKYAAGSPAKTSL